MKKILSLIFALFSCISSIATEFEDSTYFIKLNIPDEYKITYQAPKNKSVLRAEFTHDNLNYVQVLFFAINNCDKDKVIAASDSLFINIPDFKMTSRQEGNISDVETIYVNERSGNYIKIYKNVHNDGATFIVAYSNSNNFYTCDKLVESYSRSGRWLRILLVTFVFLIPIFIISYATSYWGSNKPKFIVYFTIGMIIALIPAFWISLSALLIVPIVGIICYIARDYVIISF